MYLCEKQRMYLRRQIHNKKIILKKNVDFSVVDFHGEITSEKMAIGHFFDGLATCVVGTHTCSNCRYKNFR